MLTAAVYARYSSELQRITSIEDQVRLCREAGSRFDCVVPDGLVFIDAEISGATGQRPGYQALLEGARCQRFGAILVEAQDRLWRDQGEMHHALKRLRFWGVRVIAVTTGTDLTDRAGGVLATIYGLKDELFLADLKDKTRRGMEGTIRRGLSAGGRTFGYSSEPLRDGSGRIVGARRVKNPAEAATVLYIHQLYVEGLTPRAIAHRLNDEGVTPPRTARGRRTGSWTPSTIAGSTPRALGILNNPLYVGRLGWNRSQKVRDPDTGRRTVRPRPPEEWLWTEVPELRIVPQDLWERVQARRKQRRFTATGATGGTRPRFLLSGLLECAECGSRYVIQRHRAGVRHYACAAHYDRGASVCGNGKLVRQETIEKMILDHIFGDLFAPHRLAYLSRAVDAAIREDTRNSTGVMAQREAALREAQRGLNNIAHAIREGILTPTTKVELEKAERQVLLCEAAVREAKQPAPVVVVKTAIDRYLADLRATVEGDIDGARRLLTRGFDRIVLRRDEDGHLWAEVRGNLAGLLNLEDADLVARVGAGSPEQMKSECPWPVIVGAVA